MFLIMLHSLFSTLLNLLGDAVAFVKQSASCVSLVHQFTEMSFFFFFSSISLMMHTSTFSLFSFNVFMGCTESNNDFRVRFNNSWFVFLDSSWSFHASENTYFTNHVEWREHKVMTSKLANKYQIIWQCNSFKSTLIDYFHRLFPASSISFSSKSFVNIFTEQKITNWKDDTINHSNIYFLFDLLWCQKGIS